MAISNTIKDKLNKMNRAAKDALLGTFVQKVGLASGSTLVTTAQMSASSVTIYDPALAGGNNMFLWQLYRSGSLISVTQGYVVTRSGGSMTIVDRNSGSFITNDVIEYFIY